MDMLNAGRDYPRSSITIGEPWNQRTYYELHTLYPVPPGYRIEIIRVTVPLFGEQEKEWGRWVRDNGATGRDGKE